MSAPAPWWLDEQATTLTVADEDWLDEQPVIPKDEYDSYAYRTGFWDTFCVCGVCAIGERRARDSAGCVLLLFLIFVFFNVSWDRTVVPGL